MIRPRTKIFLVIRKIMITRLTIKVENMKNYDTHYNKKTLNALKSKINSLRIKKLIMINILFFICFTYFSSSEIAHATGIDNNEIDSNVDVDGTLGPID